MPFEIYNSQTIVHDRSVYKFDCIFESDTIQVFFKMILGECLRGRWKGSYGSVYLRVQRDYLCLWEYRKRKDLYDVW